MLNKACLGYNCQRYYQPSKIELYRFEGTAVTVEKLLELIATMVRGGDTPTQAYKNLSMMLPDENGQAMLREAARIFEEQTHRIRTLKDPAAIKTGGLRDWYPGPSPEDVFWPPLRDYLLQEKHWNETAVNSVDTASSKIVSLLQPPGLAEIDTRGLVVGYVQSGKTANFTAVIAKAADVNYKLFIVLSGITDNLRNQTQERLEMELVDLNREQWFTLTSRDEDFRPGPIRNVDAFLTDHQHFKLLAVVKKNAGVLRRLLRWLQNASKHVLSNCPVLIIDDEADQASINASKYADRRTAINQLILNIIDLLPKSAYVGYTATPFANVFIDPAARDLYPRDFIVALSKPEGYFGSERIFGRERLWEDDDGGRQEVKLDMIRIVPPDEIAHLQPRSRTAKDTFEPELTESLEQALYYFWLAAAGRASRNQRHRHMTMLIHTSVYTIVHERFAPLVENFRLQILKRLKNKNAAVIEQFQHQWEDEQSRVSAEDFDELPIAFSELEPYLLEIVQSTEVVVDNSRSQKRLTYVKEEAGKLGKIQIVVGGDTLSRGLTLEGLTVSYFLRTATAYDTLLQMGRWFGYRTGYAELTRMWMTLELAHWFYDLATIEEEIRIDIRRYEEENLTPEDFAVRVRTHPSLSITSELKMQSAVVAQVGYNNTREQTILFKRLEDDWLQRNIEALIQMTEALRQANINPDTTKGENLIFRDVPVQLVIDFLNAYSFHEQRASLSSKSLTGYIHEQNSYDDLLHWNVVIRSAKSDQPMLDLGDDLQIRTIVRSRRNRQGWMNQSDAVNDANADLGVLMSRGDRVIDLDLKPDDTKGRDDEELQDLRPTGLGLLIIYPISKDSPVTERNPDPNRPPLRLPMEAKQHVIGLGIVFPKSQHFVTQTYLTADLSRIPREEVEWDFAEENGE